MKSLMVIQVKMDKDSRDTSSDESSMFAAKMEKNDLSEVVLQTFRDDGERHMYQFEIRNPGPEMTESKVISKNSCVEMELQFDTTCPPSLNFWNSHGKMPGFFLWGYLKDRIFHDRLQTLEQLEDISWEIRNIHSVMARIKENMNNLVEMCLAKNGGR
ncbi:hypothetical protein ANN_13689 [Periplaneta americana]|uniref:Uncharacterized protein n=1 Tax=Periplaneta americana TaxID=6978 RepID=A0ABQ8SVF7_PERAM|nr:hypothetical protein ANN_13689 [Periplaneta americana]